MGARSWTGSLTAESIAWVPSLDLVLDLRVDAYALVFLYVIAVAGICIFLYAARYFGSGPKVGTFAGTMTLFGGAMVGLVAADHLLATFLFWELTTITSYFLIGYSDQQESARSAALHAALVTGGGGLALLAGMVMIGSEAGTFTISEILANPPSASAAMGVAWALVLIGAVTKSAQFPFHGWLPGAMAAPTPASAYLHSATMVKAGIFLVGRLAPAALVAVEWWRPTVLAIGFATMIIGGWQALRQNDLKLLLAYGTVSQLGFLFLLVGAGDAKLLYGGLALLVAHALFKATLFMVVGTIDHEAGTRDLRRLSGLRTSLPGHVLGGRGGRRLDGCLPPHLRLRGQRGGLRRVGWCGHRHDCGGCCRLDLDGRLYGPVPHRCLWRSSCRPRTGDPGGSLAPERPRLGAGFPGGRGGGDRIGSRGGSPAIRRRCGGRPGSCVGRQAGGLARIRAGPWLVDVLAG